MAGGQNISEIKNKNVRTLMYQKLKKEKLKVNYSKKRFIEKIKKNSKLKKLKGQEKTKA